ncbi:MAG: SGNH/GDSL hydrolase family protein [Lactococcus plantarum]|nr:SGNH/GDSL hydrolase family protein [Lactococcus plantarum]MDN6069767.1 SGNH/GDSL hydrolase family protein [Lactococcus plantarum]
MRQNSKKNLLVRWLLEIVVFVMAIFAIFFTVNYFWLRPVGSEMTNKYAKLRLAHQRMNYVAIGDSLTQGVGDKTAQGGFVPLLAHELDDTYDVSVVFQNFGVAGNTSKQIYNQITKQTKIQSALKKSDLITLTVGGNDVMKVIRTNLTNLSESSFDQPALEYQKQLNDLLIYIRQQNKDAQVFVLGIYNPFYLNFPNITQMQTITDKWNEASKEVVNQQDKMYFVPINDLIYKGINGNQGVSESDQETKTITNDALFEEDHFHPNNTGYKIMSDAVAKAYREHRNEK